MDSDNSHEQRLLRRQAHRRRVYMRRRIVAGTILIAFVGGLAGIVSALASGGSSPKAAPAVPEHPKKPVDPNSVPEPKEIRGVHVTMSLAALPGKISQYLRLTRHGLNTLEVDVKDETGQVGFVPKSVPLASQIGAAQDDYNPWKLAKLVHKHHVYLIGRIVTFEDPYLSEKQPSTAIRTTSGGIWKNTIGLGWTNPYNATVWKYNADLGAAAAKAGFDEIQYDYVRFPSDGDLSIIVYPGKVSESMDWTITRFIHYVTKRLHPLGVRVGADVFGLAANHNLGIGQSPRKVGKYLDHVSPMVYPSHYGPGEYNIPDPNAAPGKIVYRSLRDFNHVLTGRRAQLVPWLQAFTLGYPAYGMAQIRAQIAAARRAHTRGFLLWNADGDYIPQALNPPKGTGAPASTPKTTTSST